MLFRRSICGDMVCRLTTLVLSQQAFVSVVRAGQLAQNELHPSPKASISLICSTSDPSDCYPSIFQPTVYFQPIRPDQSIPPGLHVRLNLATGEKEARLNVPQEDEDIDRGAVVVIDEGWNDGDQKVAEIDVEEEQLIDPIQLKLQHALTQEKHAKSYKPSSPLIDDPAENSLYDDAVSYLTEAEDLYTDSEATLSHLESLTDLAHSLEWGLIITRDANLCSRLINLINEPVLNDLKIRSESILILGTAVQNNPEALAALLAHERSMNLPHSKGHHRATAPSSLLAVMSVLANQTSSLAKDPNEDEAIIVGRAVFTLSQLCFERIQMGLWLDRQELGSDNDGLSQFFNILSSVRPHFRHTRLTHGVREKLQKIVVRIVNFMTDHFEMIADQFGNDDTTVLKRWCPVFAGLLDDKLDRAVISSVIEARQELSRLLTVRGQVPCDGGVRSKAQLPDL